MTADEFVKAIRKGGSTFRVARVILRAEDQVIRGRGFLAVVNDNFEISLEVALNNKVPDPERELWKPIHAWKISGEIEGGLKFTSDTVTPAGRNFSWGVGRKPVHVQKLHLESIDFAAAPLSRNAGKILKRSAQRRPQYPAVEFRGVLFECEMAFLNAGTETKIRNDFLGMCGGGGALDTFIDRGPAYDFALIKKEGDLYVHFRSKGSYGSTSSSEDWRRFTAFLMGIGFTHGFQPWPYRIEYWRNGKKAEDQVKPPRRLTKTHHAPFDREIGIIGNLRKKGSRNSAIRIAANLFESESIFTQEISRLLFLFRETGSSSLHIATLALCSLFEGAVNLLFDHLQLESEMRKSDPKFDEYLKTRKRLAARLQKLAVKHESQTFSRLAGTLNAAKEFRVEDKFRAICLHFGLTYEDDMKKHFEAWSRKRNPLMHGTWKDTDTDFLDQALIAGAINIFILKLMRFSGKMKFNAFAQKSEAKYRTI